MCVPADVRLILILIFVRILIPAIAFKRQDDAYKKSLADDMIKSRQVYIPAFNASHPDAETKIKEMVRKFYSTAYNVHSRKTDLVLRLWSLSVSRSLVLW